MQRLMIPKLITVMCLFCISDGNTADEGACSHETVRNQIESLSRRIDYLDSEHGSRDEKWQQYKQEFSSTVNRIWKPLVSRGEVSPEQLAKAAKQLSELKGKIPLRLPCGPEGPGRFGAYHARLKYDLDWDRFWRVADHPDVIVRFGEYDHRFVFWRGTGFIPCWATYNGAWYTNEFFERRGHLGGCSSMCEPISDKQCRYSHVRIIENSTARVVIHWRYAPVDLDYVQPYRDKITGWGDWADEYYTIYPDSVGVRKATIHSGSPPDHWIEYQESIVINQPGTMPEDSMNLDAVTLANLKGESRTYVWTKEGGPVFDDPPDKSCIQVINIKNAYKPFTVVNPDGARISVFGGHGQNSHFNWWNHWPVSQEKSDLTEATTGKRPSHSSLAHVEWKQYSQQGISRTWIMLHGMTDKSAGELALLAKSWLCPPQLRLPADHDFRGGQYDPQQRAYVLDCIKTNSSSGFGFRLLAGEDSPLVNPAFVIGNWGEHSVGLKLDGKDLVPGKDFLLGYHPTAKSRNLIVWLRMESTKPVTVLLVRKQAK